MAFQGKKRILYYIIQITSVLPLMILQKEEDNSNPENVEDFSKTHG